MAKNNNLHKAKVEKNDEFYTQLSDIEKELHHYKHHFKDKVVYCNCDDPEWSNFFKYFHLNMKHLGIKKLITTHYDKEKPTYKLEVYGQEKNVPLNLFDLVLDENNNAYNTEKVYKTYLNSNGDFRSPECIEILKEADIVVSNPPFSLFREYVAQLIEYNKKFVIIGNKNAITYKEFFPLLKDNKVWIGYNNVKEFLKPDGSIQKFGNIGWFTNLDINKRHEELILYKKYYEADGITPLPDSYINYPKYDNYDAINVDKVTDIPVDYFGVIGVPITFMDKYNPSQMIIEDANNFRVNDLIPVKEHGLIKDKEAKITISCDTPKTVVERERELPTLESLSEEIARWFEIIGNEYSERIEKGRGYINGKRIYSRIFIKRRVW